MTQKEKCQRAYRRYRAAQVHATAIMALPLTDLTYDNVDAAVAFLNSTYDDYRLQRAQHNCTRFCIDQSLFDENATLCPDEATDAERRGRLIRLARKVRDAA